jgi:hypothetical protein
MARTDPHLLDAPTLAARLRELAREKRNVDVDFLLHLDVFDARSAYLEAGFSSLWDFCLKELHLREGAAGRRIAAMRVLRRLPQLEAPLRDGRLCLSTITLLAPLLTPENLEDVVARAAYRSRAEVDHLVASLQPRTAPREGIRELPEPKTTSEESPVAGVPKRAESGPIRAATENATESQLAPMADDDAPDRRAPAPRPTSPSEPRRAAELRAMSATEWSLRVTIDDALKADLETLVSLLSHSKGSDLAAVLREAVRCAIEKHGKRKGAVEPARVGTRRPTPPDSADASRARDGVPDRANDALAAKRVSARSWSRFVPASVRREVWHRDGGCCAWTGPDGRRCGSRWKVELDHVDPFGIAGPCTDPSKLRLLCARHNAYYAEQVYGREHMERYRSPRPPRADGPAVVPGLFVREPELAWGEAGAA